MGQGLAIGVATSIDIKKQYYHKGKEDILKKIEDFINLELYEISEDDDYVTLNIKEDVFIDNIYNLLKQELEIISLDDDEKHKEKLKEVLDKVQKAETVEEVEYIADDDDTYYLHLMHGNRYEDISYMCKEDLDIMPTLVVYEFSYKTYMECYGEVLRYMREKIKKSMDNPLKDDIFLMICTG